MRRKLGVSMIVCLSVSDEVYRFVLSAIFWVDR
jgi:hypothetical protein